ncbi:MAG: DNA-directed DNA polymerase II small subunit [Thermoplasmata archaeon]|nr:MAG: DNA-directed DNA polymerase II small subunit [Thermoplasmata archaeon]
MPAKMDREAIISFFQQHGMLIEPEAVDYILKSGENVIDIFEAIEKKPLVLSLDMLKSLLEKPKIEKKAVEIKEDDEEEFKILKDVTNRIEAGGLDGFLNVFRDRYEKIASLIRKRHEMRSVIPIKRINRHEDVAVIGIVRDVRSVRNGYIAEIEDEEAWFPVFIPKDVDSAIVNDEVIGIIGKRKNDLLIARSIVRPEIPIMKKKNGASDGYIVFTSDTHIGSKSFLEKKWEKFIKWLNGEIGNERQKEVAKKIKYIVISGDIIEGVGVYPKQEYDLAIEDLYEQYEEVAKRLNDVPENIKIVLQPGNHDAVRPPLPQPAFEKEIRELFDGNVIFVGNPCYMKIDGIVILTYHGQSIQDFATTLPGLSQNEPTKIMREMLRRRHLAPMYGSITSIAPEREDYLVIDTIPDIFVTGHVHTTAVENYRGVLLMNASAWQSQTDYQKTMNFMPDPAKAIVVNMRNLMASVMTF